MSKDIISAKPRVKSADHSDEWSSVWGILIFIMLVIPYLILALVALGQGKLYQVVSMFRHGARYAMNSYYDGDFYKELGGELTSVGMKQH